MHLPLPIRLRRRARGQTMVLGALSFLVLALMVVLSFNLSQALRAKVSLQQHSDSLAYSMAVMEARALNYYAVTNRTIAASYAAMNSLHAYMAAASVTGQMMRAGSKNFGDIARFEYLLCHSCKKCKPHCHHAQEAERIADNYGQAADRCDQSVRALEPSFRSALGALDQMVDELHTSQRRVHTRTQEAVKDGMSHGLRWLAQRNAPGVSALPEGVGALNVNAFDCAIDGLKCSGGAPSSSPRLRAKVMTEIANATRAPWATHRAPVIEGSYPRYLHREFLADLERRIPGAGSHAVVSHQGTAKLATGPGAIHGGGQQDGNPGLVLGADEHGRMSNRGAHTPPFVSSYQTRLWSDASGGGHEGLSHGRVHTFEGVNARALENCLSQGNCFMKFRADADPRRDWGQPRVYSYVTQNLRIGQPSKAPWELNASATVSFTHGRQGTARLTLAPDEGAGLSKALVYYHRFDEADLTEPSTARGEGWREPPNLFAPYWRAKLHPFTPEQAQEVLRAAGDEEAARLVQDSHGLAL